MRVLCGPAQAELVFQRSRFLGLLEPVHDPEHARSLLKAAKARYADASHVVHAFRTGTDGSQMLGCSDDGEPPGTAGRPILDILKGEGGGNALLLVVRWFGGIKLGTGGLVKAYGETAKAAIGAAFWEQARQWRVAKITVDWGEHRALTNDLAAVGAHIDAETFSAGVTLEVRIPEEAFDALQTRTVDLTRGRTRWTPAN